MLLDIQDQQKRILSNDNYSTNNWLLGHYNGNTGSHYSGNPSGWVSSSSGDGSIGATDWAIYTCSRDHSADDADFWINGTKERDDSSSGNNGPTRFIISHTIQNSDCAVGVILVYDRVLSDSEITQNYNALKSRYGLS